MKTTINGIAYEGTPAELAELARLLSAAPAPSTKPAHTYTPRPETRAKLDSYLAIPDSSLATIIRQSFSATPEDKRKFTFLFLRGIVHGVETRKLDLARVSDTEIAARVRDSISRQLADGTASTATKLLDSYAKRTLASSTK